MDALVLVGPNGVGKSTVGRALAETGEFEYLDLEAFFARRYASLAAYRADRANAYVQFEDTVRSRIAADALPVVFEEVGINASALGMLTALRRDYHVVLVELHASVESCIHRAAQREGGERFPKTAVSVRDVWERFATDRALLGPIEHRIDTEMLDVSAIVDQILAVLTEG
ncbi:AAA family ATPase [Gemmatimonas groenlandica]|uniref:AAA family ATPase n=1 Tax=Gemmatimonas groenlandica TaxID=2732249 RepID=A0A6M4IZF3_9BACT|nr:AAA family ATPase [Gemmatimonas groenlandica]QJR37601.1 AAA family ATPase [Gemmatimonas groenlandica]